MGLTDILHFRFQRKLQKELSGLQRISDNMESDEFIYIREHLLACLISRPNVVVPKQELTRAGWDDSVGVTENALHQRIYHLRLRMEGCGLSECIRGVRGVGYRFEPPFQLNSTE